MISTDHTTQLLEFQQPIYNMKTVCVCVVLHIAC